jgi:DNA-binding MarR family transcriptional regulator/GNAT superfamily N-acetyltransferase
MEDTIDRVRSFNRFYTELIGLLNRTHLASDYSLTEVRLLFELHHEGPITATTLRQKLHLDAGYLSRMLKVFQKHGLIERTASPHDARQSTIRLTPAGRETFAHLDRRATAEIRRLLQPLADTRQKQLVSALETAQALLSGGEPGPEYSLRTHLPGDMGWVVERHGAVYAQEYGWNARFEALVARIVSDFLENFKPDQERCWIAERNGLRVGSVFLVRKAQGIAQLRLLLVEPQARGLGLGSRLVRECEDFAKRVGYRSIQLWTNHVLDSARKIYEKAGYQIIGEKSHRDFGPELTGQEWEKLL